MKQSHKLILKDILAKNTVIMRRTDYNLGRRKIYEKRTVILPRKLRPIYKTIEDEFILEYKKHFDKTIYAMRAFQWLARLCGGFVEDDFIWDGKLKLLKEVLTDELANEQVVVFCRFKSEINFIYSYLEKYIADKMFTILYGDTPPKKRKQILNNFRNGNYAFLITSSVIQYGVDLKNASAIIYYSQPNGEEARVQTEDRIITLSDEKTVLIIDLLVKNTVDSDIRTSHILHESERQLFERSIKRRQHE
jgi:superfamily II DNA or RNA helicase